MDGPRWCWLIRCISFGLFNCFIGTVFTHYFYGSGFDFPRRSIRVPLQSHAHQIPLGSCVYLGLYLIELFPRRDFRGLYPRYSDYKWYLQRWWMGLVHAIYMFYWSRGRGDVCHFRLWLAHLENRKRDTTTDVSSDA